MGLQLSRLTSPAPDAAANKAPGSWQGTQPSPRAPEAACHLPPQVPQFQAPESSWHCPGQGCPSLLPLLKRPTHTLLRSPGHSCFPRALHIPN